MPAVDIRIPQLGEGLQEARIVRFLKQPGDSIRQDEPIYEMETDKAVMEIESPTAGVLSEWLAHEDDVLPIGAVVGRIATDAEVDLAGASEARVSLAPIGQTPEAREAAAEEQAAAAAPATAPPAGPLRTAAVPPRTRAYAREKGVPEQVLAALAREAGGKLLPDAIDRYLGQVAGSAAAEAPASGVAAAPREPATGYTDVPLPPRQRTLAYHLQRSAQSVIPATMEVAVDWGGIEAARANIEQQGGLANGRTPTQFVLFAWCVAQAAREHPRFRAALLNDTTLRQYDRLSLGIAVARNDDELLTARVPDADALALPDFAAAAREAIERARAGEDQSSDVMQLSLTNLASAGVRLGIPVVVAPAVGTLFIGAPVDEAYPLPAGGIGFRRRASMVLTFDHRVVNGLGAARFLADVAARVAAMAGA